MSVGNFNEREFLICASRRPKIKTRIEVSSLLAMLTESSWWGNAEDPAMSDGDGRRVFLVPAPASAAR